MTNFFLAVAILLAADLACSTSPPFIKPIPTYRQGCCLGGNPCDKPNCPAYPYAKCRPKTCGKYVKCEPQYYTPLKDLSIRDCNQPSE